MIGWFIYFQKSIQKRKVRFNIEVCCSCSELVLSGYFRILFGVFKSDSEEIDVYIISSNSQIEGKINNYIKNKDNVHYVKKTNRGRDVSALLITARDIVMNYNYICFIHDKKPNFEYLAEDIRFWNQNLWDNTIKSKQYIENVLEIFEEHKEIGLLVPPKPIGVYIPDWHTNAWRDDFKIVQQLCREFDLKCDLDPQKPVVTLGTVFWGKTKILYKILSKKWKYEDFPDEPMPLDGTVSHGLERILAYAAQDAGFETGIVMCDSYARTLYIKIQDMMMETYRNLSENFYIEQLDQLMSYKKQKEFIVKAFGRNKSVYLYGAGKYGCRFKNDTYVGIFTKGVRCVRRAQENRFC